MDSYDYLNFEGAILPVCPQGHAVYEGQTQSAACNLTTYEVESGKLYATPAWMGWADEEPGNRTEEKTSATWILLSGCPQCEEVHGATAQYQWILTFSEGFLTKISPPITVKPALGLNSSEIPYLVAQFLNRDEDNWPTEDEVLLQGERNERLPLGRSPVHQQLDILRAYFEDVNSQS